METAGSDTDNLSDPLGRYRSRFGYAWTWPATICQCNDYHDFVRARCTRRRDRQCIDFIKRPDIVFMPQWDIDGSTGGTYFDVRWNDGLATADCIAHRLSHSWMNDCGCVFDVTCRAHYGALAIRKNWCLQRIGGGSYQIGAQFGTEWDQCLQIVRYNASERIRYHSAGGNTCDGHDRRGTALEANSIFHHERSPDFHFKLQQGGRNSGA
jgi:hypothetical protein